MSSQLRIPCFLTNRDMLTPVQAMVDRLRLCDGVGDIFIMDCGSQYPPLLEWYKVAEATVVMLPNWGNHALWRWLREGAKMPQHTHYFMSDADLDLAEVPLDFLRVLQQGLTDHRDYLKAGLSLMVADLPDTPYAKYVHSREAGYWRHPVGTRFFAADIDTTGVLYRAGSGWGGYGPSLRAAPPYVARHPLWYVDPRLPDTWSDELKHYVSRANSQFSSWTGHTSPDSRKYVAPH